MVLSLLCDDHIFYSIVKGLRRRGSDVITVQKKKKSVNLSKSVSQIEGGRKLYFIYNKKPESFFFSLISGLVLIL
jgi:hypothetical protein